MAVSVQSRASCSGILVNSDFTISRQKTLVCGRQVFVLS